MAGHDLLARDQLVAVQNVIETALNVAVLAVAAMTIGVENGPRLPGQHRRIVGGELAALNPRTRPASKATRFIGISRTIAPTAGQHYSRLPRSLRCHSITCAVCYTNGVAGPGI